jgi:hypothetical protein
MKIASITFKKGKVRKVKSSGYTVGPVLVRDEIPQQKVYQNDFPDI